MFNVNDANISMTSSSCEFRKLFVIENFLARIVKNKQTVFLLRNELKSRKLCEKNVQVTLYRAELWLLMLIEVVNRFKFWVKSVSQ